MSKFGFRQLMRNHTFITMASLKHQLTSYSATFSTICQSNSKGNIKAPNSCFFLRGIHLSVFCFCFVFWWWWWWWWWWWGGGGGGGLIKDQGGGGAYELLNLRALKISMLYKNVWVRYFVWNFKGYLWNSTQNISPIHWKMWILFKGEDLRALRFKSW